jgi:hypothetical protein
MLAVYRQKLSSALAPMLAANRTLTGALQTLDGSNTSITAAGNASSQAQSAVIGARGAVAVLAVPSSESTLSQQVGQALTDENGYLHTVSATLATPVGQTVSQLQTLATGAQSALVPLDAVAAGAGSSLGDTDNLISWATGAAALAARHQAAAQQRAQHAQQRAAQQSSRGGSSQRSSSGSGGSAAVSSSTPCGGGIIAGPNTSSPFALNVHAASEAAPGLNNTLQVFSPVTGQTYTMTCAQAGAGITCSGGNNASVSW